MRSDCPFGDAQHVATITSRQIIEGDDWIYYVGHDDDDGAWQFHGEGGPCEEADAVVVSLRSVVERDPTIRSLADLPLGWCAWRESPDSEGLRAPRQR